MEVKMSYNVTFVSCEQHTEYWDAAARKLWEDNFDDSEEYREFYFKERWRVSSAFFLGDVSMMHLCPYTLYFFGREISANYLVGVCTAVSERRKGHMARLLGECFKMLYLGKEPFLYLMPADTRIYAPFGFREFYEIRSYHGSLDNAINLYREKIPCVLCQEEMPCVLYQEEMPCKSSQKIMSCYLNQAEMSCDPNQEEMQCNLNQAGMSCRNQIIIKEYRQLSEREREEVSGFAYRQLKAKVKCFVRRDNDYFKLRADEMESCRGALLTFWKTEAQAKTVGYAMLMREDGVEISEFIVEKGFEYFVLKALKDVLPDEEQLEIHICETMFLGELSGAGKKLLMGRIICLEEFISSLSIRNVENVIDKIHENANTKPDFDNLGITTDGKDMHPDKTGGKDMHSDKTGGKDMYLDITDRMIAENSGLWRLTFDKKSVGIIKIKEDWDRKQNVFTKITIERLFECLMMGCGFYLNEMV